MRRSAIVADWIEMKQVIETTDRMLLLLKDRDKEIPYADLFQLADDSRQLREQRKNWLDRWNYDLLADHHDERVRASSGTFADYEEALELVAEWLSPIPGETGLDLGVGTGNLASKLLDRGARMCGVDQSAKMLEQCAAKLPELETKLGNMLAVPYTNGQFDFIASSFAFRHLSAEQQPLALEEMRRVLKPHGRISIADLFSLSDADSDLDDSDPMSGYPKLPTVIRWLEAHGYMTRARRINDMLHLVCAVPIRPQNRY
ncbi:class I SAM-dependent methyltransferase [Cohnella faecalis]|nr:class I SAM-dependent methyltransferase [Cohnella faecalis]